MGPTSTSTIFLLVPLHRTPATPASGHSGGTDALAGAAQCASGRLVLAAGRSAEGEQWSCGGKLAQARSRQPSDSIRCYTHHTTLNNRPAVLLASSSRIWKDLLLDLSVNLDLDELKEQINIILRSIDGEQDPTDSKSGSRCDS